MEPEAPDDRPESPKKKIRPSSTTSSEVLNSDRTNSTDGVQISANHNSEMNGLAPTRRGREAQASIPCGRDTNAARNDHASIQEEVVSSSENLVQSRYNPLSYNEGNADSLTSEADDPNSCEAVCVVSAQDREAENEL
ncbi:uncharacterized protein TNCT_453721 [Trichonephila clavata]|uniref:Uncharacterized protein n=1 Tax=Trichonephila clavata TaxID=2740835 RepID=A0A8X6G5E5_TRICU|nr:uncharacterized protein TNCT_453721 [Trichonephila clavata]